MSSTSDFNSFAARLRELIRASECGVRSAPAVAGLWRGQECGVQLEPPYPAERDCYEESFDSLALGLFALQFEHNAPYRRFCESRGAMAGVVEHWSEIPAIPAVAFKELELSCLPAAERTVAFHSSGTTGQRPSRHFHNADSLAIYEASLVAWFAVNFQGPFALSLSGKKKVEGPLTPALSRSEGERENHLAVSSEQRQGLLILTPSPAEAPHSSLVHMFDTLRREFGSDNSVYLGRSDVDGSWLLALDAAIEALSRFSAAPQPVLLLGTAFSYVHLLDELARRGRRFELPSGSRAMETGGYKGRSRCLERSELHSLITHHLGIPSRNIVCEYGMSELSSQAYAGTLPGSRITHHTTRFRFPPWCKVQIISPETGREVGEGATGLIRLFDLANAYSVMAIQTEDLGIRRGDGFELLGRAVLAEPRGCSLMATA